MNIQEAKQATCQAIKKDGTRCTCAPIRGTKFCYYHSPRQRSPKKTEPIISEKESFDLSTIEGINSLLSLTVKGLLAKKIDAKTAQTLGYNLNILSKNIVNVDLEKRIETLEKQLEKIHD